MMRTRSYLWRLLALPAAAACDSAETKAVKNVLEFATSAPYSLAAPDGRYEPYTVVVEDSALASYNAVFGYFQEPDSNRSNFYRELPAALLWSLPVTRVASISQAKHGDTTVVTAAFMRPDRKLFASSFSSYLWVTDTAPPIELVRSNFKRALARARNELQEPDTAWFWLVGQSKIVKWGTASFREDSAAAEAAIAKARTQLEQFIGTARLRDVRVSDYSSAHLLLRDAGGGGGAVEGYVDPNGAAVDTAALVSLEVQCEGRRDSEATIEDAYVSLSKLAANKPERFLCLWSGDLAEEWYRIRPTSFRVRLAAMIGRDSLVAPWIPIRR